MKLASLLCLSWELWLIILPCTSSALATPLSTIHEAQSSEPRSLRMRHKQASGHGPTSADLLVRRGGAISTLDDWAIKQKRKVEMRYNRRGGYATEPTRAKMARRQQQQQQQSGQRGYVELHNLYSDTEYYGEIQLGTPARPYNVILDTGSSDLWLAGPKCTSATGCEETTQLYGVAPSRTMFLHNSTEVGNEHLPLLFNVSYGSGEASGALVKDTLSVGGYTIHNQSFASCEYVTPGLLAGNISGILGLGFQSISSADVKPFWQLLAENHHISLNSTNNRYGAKDSSFELGFAFTRFLHNPDSASQAMPGGSMSLGSRNESLYEGDIRWNTVEQKGYWMIEMEDIKLGDRSLGLGSKLVAVDTGTSLIGGPSQAVQALYDQIPGSGPAEDPLYAGYYTFPCSTSAVVSLVFNRTEWPISPYDFNLGRVGDGSRCLGSIFSLADKDPSSSPSPSSTMQSPDWIIGDSFLKNVYTVFRYENPTAVGFAKRSQEAEDLSQKPEIEGNASVMDMNKQVKDVSGDARATRRVVGGRGGIMAMGLLMLYGAAGIW